MASQKRIERIEERLDCAFDEVTSQKKERLTGIGRLIEKRLDCALAEKERQLN